MHSRPFALLLLLIVAAFTTASRLSAAYFVQTIAGTAEQTGSTNGTGTEARFFNPIGVVADAAGNVYVGDTGNNLVRKISPTGTVTTLAGSGVLGSADGTGAAAQFSYPWGLAIDSAGNLYVCDSGNHTIRKITPEGVVTTLAGSAGQSGSTDGTGANARFSHPSSIAIDGSGNLFVTDYNNSTIRKITPAGAVSTLAGSAGQFGFADGQGSSAVFNYPDGIAVDSAGDIWVSDSNNHVIRHVSAGGFVTTIAGAAGASGSQDGFGSVARFSNPIGITVGPDNALYVVDSHNHAIRRVLTNGDVSTVAGSLGVSGAVDGRADQARFNNPTALALAPGGTLIVTDTFNHVVRSVYAGRDGGKVDPDVNGDGYPDIVWQNTTTGQRSIWFMKGTAYVGMADLGVVGVDWSMAATADFNHDGSADILWQNAATGQRYIWLMKGAAHTGDVDLGTRSVDWSIACTGDMNGDGSPDIIWQNTVTGQRTVWLMQGTTHTGDVDWGTVSTQWSIVAAADFNADGQIDVLWQHLTAGHRTIWLMNGTTRVGDIDLGAVTDDWSMAMAADFNGDGQSDILWQNTSMGLRYIWLMDHGAHYGDVDLGVRSTEWSILTPPAAVLKAHDFDANGKPDLVVQNVVDGSRRIWIMNGSTHASSVDLANLSTDWSVAATGDFDGDWQNDLLVQNTVTGERVIRFMDGTTFRSMLSLGVVSLDWSVVSAGDFNGDGQTDILWQNTATGQRYIWLMNGTTHFGDIDLGTISTNLSIVTTADIDRNGSIDIIWQDIDTGHLYVWLMRFTQHTGDLDLGLAPANSVVVSSGDYNSDGQIDLVFENTSTGRRFAWLLNRGAFISEVEIETSSTDWQIAD
jgi:sugar lactone lactonase YvrE